MPIQVGLFLCESICSKRSRRAASDIPGGLTLGLKGSARMRRGWFSAACAGALIFTVAAPRSTAAQETSGSNTVHSKTQAETKTANPKDSAKASPKTTKTTPSSAKAHAASHSAANTSVKSKQASLRKSRNHKTTARGQQKIDPERAQAIQDALIREHYLSVGTTGNWNQASEEAMRRYQADHGWQSKTVPDSRALISLGLGPSHDHLLNPQSAMTTGPETPRATSLRPTAHSADPGTRLSVTPPPQADPTPVPSSSQDTPGPQ
jgi:hypothetical protein